MACAARPTRTSSIASPIAHAAHRLPLLQHQLRVFPDMTAHNIRRLHQAGLCVSVNSDDPFYFGGYINENFAAIAEALGFSDDDLWRLARNGFTSAFLSDDLRNRYLAELDARRPHTA
jgi:adenosine deaminase